MPAHTALGVDRVGGDIGNQQAGGAAGIDGVRRGRGLDLRQNALLDGQALRTVLLDELGVLHRFGNAGGVGDAAFDGVRLVRLDGPELQQGFDIALHVFDAVVDLLLVDVILPDLQSPHGKQQGPAGADHAAADGRYALHVLHVHDFFLLM